MYIFKDINYACNEPLINYVTNNSLDFDAITTIFFKQTATKAHKIKNVSTAVRVN